jgi:hypothetical protein
VSRAGCERTSNQSARSNQTSQRVSQNDSSQSRSSNNTTRTSNTQTQRSQGQPPRQASQSARQSQRSASHSPLLRARLSMNFTCGQCHGCKAPSVVHKPQPKLPFQQGNKPTDPFQVHKKPNDPFQINKKPIDPFQVNKPLNDPFQVVGERPKLPFQQANKNPRRGPGPVVLQPIPGPGWVIQVPRDGPRPIVPINRRKPDFLVEDPQPPLQPQIQLPRPPFPGFLVKEGDRPLEWQVQIPPEGKDQPSLSESVTEPGQPSVTLEPTPPTAPVLERGVTQLSPVLLEGSKEPLLRPQSQQTYTPLLPQEVVQAPPPPPVQGLRPNDPGLLPALFQGSAREGGDGDRSAALSVLDLVLQPPSSPEVVVVR